MKDNENKHINIVNNENAANLLMKIQRGDEFAQTFTFADNRLHDAFLDSLKIDAQEYKKKYFYFDPIRNLHICDSELGYTWVSTLGLVTKGKSTNNNFLNACISQYTVISLLFEKAIDMVECENVYDIDKYEFGYLSDITPALFHNILFYFEVFAKAYLSLSGAKVPQTHELAKLYPLVATTMHNQNHNNSLFHAFIMTEFKKVIDHISTIPGNFKEHFVKYDDNIEDCTVIIFNLQSLRDIQDRVNMSNDLIESLYYEPDDPMYLKPGLLKRLLEKAETEEKKQQIRDMYSYLEPGQD